MAARGTRPAAHGAAIRDRRESCAVVEGLGDGRMRSRDDPRALARRHDPDRGLEGRRVALRSSAARQRARHREAGSRARRQDRVPLPGALLGGRELHPHARPLHADVVDHRPAALSDPHRLGGRPRRRRAARRAAGDPRPCARLDVARLRRSAPTPRFAPHRHLDARLAERSLQPRGVHVRGGRRLRRARRARAAAAVHALFRGRGHEQR